MPGLPNPKNTGSPAAIDLGLNGGIGDPAALDDEDEKKRRLLARQRERMGQSSQSVFGLAAGQLGLLGGMGA